MNTIQSKNKTRSKINIDTPKKTTDFKNILDRITDGVAAVDVNWNYLYINSKGAELLNVNAENLIGQNLWKYFPDAAIMEVGDSMRTAMKEQHYVYSENYYAPLDRWYENHFYPSEHGMTNIFKDITQKKKIEATLKEIEEKFNKVIDEVNIGIIIQGANAELLLVNPAAENLLGFSKDQLNKTGLNYFHGNAMKESGEKFTDQEHPVNIAINSHKAVKEVLMGFTHPATNETLWLLVNALPVLCDSKKLKYVICSFTDVTETRKQQANFKNILDRISDGFTALDKNWINIYSNKATGIMLNRPVEDLIGNSFWDNYPDVVDDPVGIAMRKAMTEQKYTQIETFYEPLNRWFESDFYPSPDGLSIIFRETTERKSAEQKRLIAEQKYKVLFERNLAGIYRTEFGGKILDCNEACAKIFGYDSAAEFLSRNAQDLYYNEQDRIDFLKVLKEKKSIFNYEVKMKRKNGTPVYLNENTMLFESPENPEGILEGIVIDLTEKKKAEKELQKSEDKFRMLIENSHDGISMLNQSGEIIYMSPAGERITGFRLEELQGKKIFEFFHPEGSAEAKSFFQKLFDNPGVTLNDTGTRLLHKNGNYILVEANVTNLLHDENVKAIIINFRDITQRLKAEAALLKSEEKFRMLIENSHEAICLLNEKREITYLSPAGERIIGFEAEEIIGKNLQEFFHPERPQRAIEFFKNVFENPGKTFYNTNRLLKKNGEYMVADVSVTNMLHDKNVNAIITNFIDITEKIKTEEALEKSKLNYKLLIEQAPDGVFISDEDDTILDVNSKGCEMLGYTLNELQQLKIPDLITPENLKSNPIRIDDYKAGKTVIIERTLIRKDKTEIEVEISGRMLEDGRYQSFVRDISARKRIERELAKSEFNYKTLIEQAPDGVFISTPDYFMQNVNEIGCKMLGYELAELQKMRFTELIAPENLMNNPINIELLKTGKTILTERILLRKNGTEIQVEINAKLLSDGRFQAFIRDISERKKIKEELREMNTRLRNLTSRIQNAIEEERKHIAREIHDELGQLLTGLKIDLSWMNKRQGLSEELTLKTEEMLSLTDRTIQSVRKIATELRPGILDDLGLNEAIIWQANEFQNKTGIECKVQGEILRTDYSPEQNITAFRIMQESLTNVMRHANANHVTITLSESENLLSLIIADDGIGIENIQNFEQKSLGILGMKERVNIIGGSLNIFSEPNRGTTVTVKIPLITK